MARKIQHKRGLEANLPQLDEAEIAFTTDSKKPFIGSADGNVEIAKKADVDAKASKTELTNAVSPKADKTYVDTELGKKASTDEVSALSAQLADTVQFRDQIDYVEQLKNLSSVIEDQTVEIVYGTQQLFRVHTKHSDKYATTRSFLKDTNDDFILDYGTYFGEVSPVDAKTSAFNYSKSEGQFTTAYVPNYWTTEVGATLGPETFKGERVDFVHYATSDGGVWEFILDEGKPSEKRKEISTWNDTALNKETMIFEGLSEAEHTIKAVFRGADPVNPPASGTARGWVYFGGTRPQDTKRTFNVYSKSFTVNKLVDVEYSASNKECAISARPNGSSEPYQFIPEHNSIGTAFKIMEPILLVDGKQAEWVSNTFHRNVKTVQLIQKVRGYHPADMENALMEITHYHVVKDGVCWHDTKIEFLRDTDIYYAYGVMFPYWATFATKVLTSTGNRYDVKTDNSKEYWNEDNARSFAVINSTATDQKGDLASAVTIEDYFETMRVNQEGRGVPFTWIEHNSGRGKLYFQTMDETVIPTGYVWRIKSKRITTFLPRINQLLI